MPSCSARPSSSISAAAALRWNVSLVVARLIRYEACVITGATLRFAVNSAHSASVYGLLTHWFEFLAKMAMAEASIAAARSNAVGRPPLVEMCAPRRSPGASGKEKRVMVGMLGRWNVGMLNTGGRAGRPNVLTFQRPNLLQSEVHRHRVVH